MSKTSHQIDKEGFETAAAAYPEVYANRDAHVAVRKFLVENNFLNPGDTADAQVYAMALGMMKANGALPQRVKTAEEIAAEAAEAKLAEDRRNAGRLFSKDDEVRPTRKIGDYADRDSLRDHNAAVDAALAKKQNPVAERMAQMEGLLARMSPAAIPGLVDESYSANVVTMASGRISHYQTQLAIAAAKEKNIQARAKFAEAEAAREAAANTGRGI